jgi:hypothetical protein
VSKRQRRKIKRLKRTNRLLRRMILTPWPGEVITEDGEMIVPPVGRAARDES